MRALKFIGHNQIFAKDQQEYKQLPAYVDDKGMVTTCWELTDAEVAKIKETSTVKLTVLTFNRPAQPISVNATRPSFPIDPKIRLMVNPHSWDGDTATFKIMVIPTALQEIIKNKTFWITTVTYGGPLQPIQGKIN